MAELDRRNLAYLHLTDNDRYRTLADLRPRWHGALIANVGENRERPQPPLPRTWRTADGYSDYPNWADSRVPCR